MAGSPVRSALREGSSLQKAIRDGLGAVKRQDRDCIESSIRAVFADSVDIDEALRRGRERENRWDYLLGHSPSGCVVGVEPHSAKDDEVNTVIRKRRAALEHLKDHLRPGAKVQKWLWVASGKVKFADTEQKRRQLDQHGIEFVGPRVMAKHLPPLAPPTRRKAKARVAR